MKKIGFTLNQYDSDGDNFDDCILIYIDNNTIIRFEDLQELDSVIEQLNNIRQDMIKNYGVEEYK